jgi:hypothetical protein
VTPPGCDSRGAAVIEFPRSYVAEPVESRLDRARRLQPRVAELVEAVGAHGVAASTALSRPAVEALAAGLVAPLPGSLDAYEEVLIAHSAAQRGMGPQRDPLAPRCASIGRAMLVSGG